VELLSEEGVEALKARRIAEVAGTSPAAIYELFEDKAGLIGAIFYEGFRLLDSRLSELGETDNPVEDLYRLFVAFREFVRDNRTLTDLMFSRPFADFDPGPQERRAGNSTRQAVVMRVRRCMDAGLLSGNEVDVAHVMLGVAQGLAIQESAGWLGTSRASIDRRWHLAFELLLRP
jgi:AcrR family transcriptional regulator